MIEFRGSVFHIGNENWSYLFRLTPYGGLEHLHFGAPADIGDSGAFAAKNVLGWGSSVLLDESDPASCLDAVPLEWSGSGRGDYRESPLEIADGNGPLATDFRYVCHRVLRLPPPIAALLPQADGSDETLEITLEQLGGGLRLRLYYTVYKDVLARRAVIENSGQSPVYVKKLMSFCADIFGKYEMSTFDGGWIRETHRHVTPVGEARVVNESTTGFSSNRHNPGFVLSEPGATEDHGGVYGFNLLYSGNHYSAAQRLLQGMTRVVGGISPDNFTKELKPGERFESPSAVMAWSGEGFSGLSKRMHSFVNNNVVPKAWRRRERPVLYNSWEGCMFDFDERRLILLAKKAKKLGCELFVLDDGWFGKRNNDTAGLGDYNVNRRKLPWGLSGLAKKIKNIGMDFGLWFEPEAVNIDSDLYRAHPDWALTNALPALTGRHELLLDLTKPEVRDYIVDSVSGVLDSADISYVKWDMNRHSCALGLKAHEYILGLYEILSRIFGPRPEILLETCSSGGNRFDLGMLCFSPQIWASDDTDPIERLDIQDGLSYLYPLSATGAHVSAAPHAQTLRDTPLATRGNASFFGLLGYELDLMHLLPVEEKEIAAQIEFYKACRKTFQFGEFSRVPFEGGTSWQVRDEDTAIVGVFHRLVGAGPKCERARVTGLEKQQKYWLTSRPQKLRVGRFGGLLRHVSPVGINPNGAILRTADRHYAMDDAKQEFTATGAALMSGWMLPPQFCGTGYHKDQRTQGDFGSNIFLMRKVNPDEEQ